jgi:hypothetical protein
LQYRKQLGNSRKEKKKGGGGSDSTVLEKTGKKRERRENKRTKQQLVTPHPQLYNNTCVRYTISKSMGCGTAL